MNWAHECGANRFRLAPHGAPSDSLPGGYSLLSRVIGITVTEAS